jgi:hypothetical protein
MKSSSWASEPRKATSANRRALAAGSTSMSVLAMRGALVGRLPRQWPHRYAPTRLT